MNGGIKIVTQSEEAINKFIEGKNYNFNELYNEEDYKDLIKDIKDDIPSEDKLGRPITDSRRKHMENLIQSSQDNIVKPQIEYIESLKENISKSESLDELNRISIDKSQFDRIENAGSKLNRQLESRKSFFERVETRKEIFLEGDPAGDIRRANRRTWGSVQRYYELSDSELSELKEKLGDDFLR